MVSTRPARGSARAYRRHPPAGQRARIDATRPRVGVRVSARQLHSITSFILTAHGAHPSSSIVPTTTRSYSCRFRYCCCYCCCCCCCCCHCCCCCYCCYCDGCSRLVPLSSQHHHARSLRSWCRCRRCCCCCYALGGGIKMRAKTRNVSTTSSSSRRGSGSGSSDGGGNIGVGKCQEMPGKRRTG